MKNKIKETKKRHDYLRASDDKSKMNIPKQGPPLASESFSTNNYFKPSNDKNDPNDSEFVPKKTTTWGIQMDPLKNGLFAHINIRPNHPYQLDKENRVINKFLLHDTPEWIQFVGDSLKNTHEVKGFQGTPWHWPHNPTGGEKKDDAKKDAAKGVEGEQKEVVKGEETKDEETKDDEKKETKTG